MGGAIPIRRPAARVLLLSERDRVLLLRCLLDRDRLGIWVTPGGALSNGETFEQGARRELWEETGLTGMSLGPCVWVRRHVFHLRGVLYEAAERYFLLRTREFEPDPAALDRAEVDDITESRWWSVEEIEAAVSEIFVPRRIAGLLGPILAGSVPNAPIDVGI